MRDGEILLYPAGQLDAVHYGHHQVADDEVYRMRVQYGQGFLAMSRF